MPLLPDDYEKLTIPPGMRCTDRMSLIFSLEDEVKRLSEEYQALLDALCDDVVKSEDEDEVCECVNSMIDALVNVRESQRLCFAQIEDLKQRCPSDGPSMPAWEKRSRRCSEIVCAHCGAKNPIDARCCTECGQPLEMGDTWRYCADCKIAYCDAIRFCPQCGKTITVEVKRRRR